MKTVVRKLKIANSTTRKLADIPFICVPNFDKSLELAKKFCKERGFRFIYLSKKITNK